jgi:hypothetical protein
MILKDLLDKYTEDAEIAEKVTLLYGEIPDGYLHALEQLRKIEPVASKDNTRIVLTACHDIDSGYYTDVCGMNGETHDGSADEMRWALDFTSWAEWLGMEIDQYVKYYYSEIDTLGHILWELTWHGFERTDSQKKWIEVDASWKDYKEHPEEAVTMEELLEDLDSDSA